MRVAVTGAGGRLGSALVTALERHGPGRGADDPQSVLSWRRPEYDLDTPGSARERLERDRPGVVVHAAAWTDVEGCAREPALARRRNGLAVGELATACAEGGVHLVLISTNEVFDGRRPDHRGYVPSDPVGPINPYGESKLLGEELARAAYRNMDSPNLAIVRTCWLFGPPGADFPVRIAAAAQRARASGEPLRLVDDEIGSPTYAPDLASAIGDLLAVGPPAGTFHIVNRGLASRRAWAEAVLAGLGLTTPTVGIPAGAWVRLSKPPGWAVLETSVPPGVRSLRPWPDAVSAYLPGLRDRLAIAR